MIGIHTIISSTLLASVLSWFQIVRSSSASSLLAATDRAALERDIAGAVVEKVRMEKE